MPPEERKGKLEEMTRKLQLAIDNESENRSELARELKQLADPDLKSKQKLQVAIQKSEDRMQSMAVLMLHYCSGKRVRLRESTRMRRWRKVLYLQTHFFPVSATIKNSFIEKQVRSDNDAS